MCHENTSYGLEALSEAGFAWSATCWDVRRGKHSVVSVRPGVACIAAFKALPDLVPRRAIATPELSAYTGSTARFHLPQGAAELNNWQLTDQFDMRTLVTSTVLLSAYQLWYPLLGWIVLGNLDITAQTYCSGEMRRTSNRGAWVSANVKTVSTAAVTQQRKLLDTTRAQDVAFKAFDGSLQKGRLVMFFNHVGNAVVTVAGAVPVKTYQWAVVRTFEHTDQDGDDHYTGMSIYTLSDTLAMVPVSSIQHHISMPHFCGTYDKRSGCGINGKHLQTEPVRTGQTFRQHKHALRHDGTDRYLYNRWCRNICE